MPRFAIARMPLLAVLILLLGLGLGRVFAVDDPQGAAGGAGTTTLDLTRHRSTFVEGIPGARGSLSVPCPAGMAAGGGFSHAGTNLRIIESRPDGIYAWRISWVQTSTDNSTLFAYAICMITSE